MANKNPNEFIKSINIKPKAKKKYKERIDDYKKELKEYKLILIHYIHFLKREKMTDKTITKIIKYAIKKGRIDHYKFKYREKFEKYHKDLNKLITI